VKALAVHLPGGWEVLTNFYLDFTIAIMAGAMLGLMVSVIASNQGIVNILNHFATEGGLILGLLVLLPFVQKRKDSI
jgi:hypothetical protein